MESRAPGTSRGCSAGSFDFGTRTAPATAASRITGTFTRNTEPQKKCSSNHPEAMGPRAAPPPEMPAQMAMALGRSSAGKTLVRIDSVDGMTNAAATPMTAREAMTVPAVSAVAAIPALMRNTNSPACSAPLRP